jgi:L-rhamnose-H+ transport protein
MWSVFSDIPFSLLAVPIFCGVLWGISAIGFSKGITLIGMSMVYGISMGISTVTGSVVPMIMNHTAPQGKSAVIFIIGLTLILIGVAVITKAGIMRDGARKGSRIGIFLAMLSGLGSGAMNVGFSSVGAEKIGKAFSEYGYVSAAISSGKWLPVLAGGCIVGILFCVAEALRKKNIHTIAESGSVKRCIILFFVSIVWFAALLLYGLSSDMLGSLGTTAGWILFNALALVISSAWGLKTGEWKGKAEAKKWLFAGNLTLIAAWLFIAMS